MFTRFLILFIISFSCLNCGLFLSGSNLISASEVIVYTSVDQIFSEPILKSFKKKTGINVLPLYDVEASKTIGLVNRLIAEKKRPKADVFWNSEVMGTVMLKEKGILTPYKSPQWRSFPDGFKDKKYYWTGFSARARVLIWNTDILKKNDLPKSIFELIRPEWKGKVAIAYPLFGTTAMHMAALYSVFGPKRTESYLTGLVKNKVVVVNGNSVTRDLVVQGRVPIGFTDTDDVNAAILRGKPVQAFFPDKKGIGTLLIPNTVALINKGPNPENGKLLIDYLLSKKTESRLAFGKSAGMPLRSEVKRPENMKDFRTIKAMNVDYNKIAQYFKKAIVLCQKLFVR